MFILGCPKQNLIHSIHSQENSQGERPWWCRWWQLADIDTSDVQVLIVHNKLDYISKLTYPCKFPILMGDTSSIRAHFTASHVKFTRGGAIRLPWCFPRFFAFQAFQKIHDRIQQLKKNLLEIRGHDSHDLLWSSVLGSILGAARWFCCLCACCLITNSHTQDVFNIVTHPKFASGVSEKHGKRCSAMEGWWLKSGDGLVFSS